MRAGSGWWRWARREFCRENTNTHEYTIMAEDTLFDFADCPSPRVLWMQRYNLAALPIALLPESVRMEWWREMPDMGEDWKYIVGPASLVSDLRALAAEVPDGGLASDEWSYWMSKIRYIVKASGNGPTEADACADYARKHRINHWSL